MTVKEMLANSVVAALVEATGLKPKAKERGPAFAKRLAKAVNGLDDDVWAELDDDVQEWADSLIESVREKTDLPDLPEVDDEDEDDDGDEDVADDEDEDEDEDESDESDDEDEDDEDEDEPAPKSRSKKKVAKKTAKKASSKKKTTKKTAKKKTTKKTAKKASSKKKTTKKTAKKVSKKTATKKKGLGMTEQFRKLVCQNPDKSKDELVTLAEKKGLQASEGTIQTVTFHTKKTIAMLRELGKLD